MNKNLIGKWWVNRITRHGEIFVSAVKQKKPIEVITFGSFTAHRASYNRESDWLDLRNPENIEGKLNIKSEDLPFTSDYFDHDGIYEIDILESGNWFISEYN